MSRAIETEIARLKEYHEGHLVWLATVIKENEKEIAKSKADIVKTRLTLEELKEDEKILGLTSGA